MAKSSYDERDGEVTQMAVNVILLDRVLGRYGPATCEARGRRIRNAVYC